MREPQPSANHATLERAMVDLQRQRPEAPRSRMAEVGTALAVGLAVVAWLVHDRLTRVPDDEIEQSCGPARVERDDQAIPVKLLAASDRGFYQGYRIYVCPGDTEFGCDDLLATRRNAPGRTEHSPRTACLLEIDTSGKYEQLTVLGSGESFPPRRKFASDELRLTAKPGNRGEPLRACVHEVVELEGYRIVGLLEPEFCGAMP